MKRVWFSNSLLQFQIMFWLSALTISFGNSSLEETRVIDPATQKIIDDYILNVYLPKSGTTNLVLSIVGEEGKLLYTTGVGFANQEKNILNNNKTQFLIASITKSFTSTVIVKALHEKYPELGESVLDTPIQKLLPAQVELILPDRYRSEHVTFRDLLAHRVCTFREDIHFNASPVQSDAEMLYRQRYAEPICDFRSQWEYNNPLYTVAGELISLVTSTSYNDLINNLLTKLEMFNSTLISFHDDYPNLPNRAMPYYIRQGVSFPMNTTLMKRYVVLRASAGLFSTADDMAKYMRFHLNKGNVKGKQIISEHVMNWITKPVIYLDQAAYKSNDDIKNDLVISMTGYALGFSIGSFDGWRFVQHGGFLPPYFSLMSLLPQQKIGVFTSCNQGRTLDATDLHNFILKVLKGGDGDPEIAKAKVAKHSEKMEQKREEEKKKKILEVQHYSKGAKRLGMDIVGNYGSGSMGELEIYEKFNEISNSTGLYFEYGKWATGWLTVNQNEVGDSEKLRIDWDTDIIQDTYAENGSFNESMHYLIIKNESLVIIADFEYGPMELGRFKLGVTLENLPVIPWSPGSC